MAARKRVASTRQSLGIRIDREYAGMIYNNISDAIWSAQKLTAHSKRSVAVFEQLDGADCQDIFKATAKASRVDAQR